MAVLAEFRNSVQRTSGRPKDTSGRPIFRGVGINEALNSFCSLISSPLSSLNSLLQPHPTLDFILSECSDLLETLVSGSSRRRLRVDR